VVETPGGPIIVDINDFPSFGQVPHALSLVSRYIEQIASHRVEQPARPKADMLTDIPQELIVPIS
jgi:ribosomal protein S6--L-glutamate ligase